MFANPTTVGISQRVVATLVACAMMLSSIGIYNIAHAADLPNISNTISDSDPSATPSHSIEFDVPAASSIGAGNNIQISFDTAGDGAGGQDFGGLAAIVNNSNLTFQVNGGGFAAPTWVASDGDSFTVSGVTASAGDTVEIVVATGVITNPSTVDSYEIQVDIANAGTDLGQTRIAIVDNVLVSAIIDTVFDFTITGLATSTVVNGTTTTGSTSPTAIHFGNLIANEPKALAQRLNVRTNARNGFVVTIESDGYLQSGNGAIIDDFANGTDISDTGTAWSAPTNSIASDLTWGHWGVSSNDGDLNSLGGFYTGEFGSQEFIAVSSTTPREVFHHDGPSNNTTANIGQVDVVYAIEISPLQEAGDDYNTTLTYIATPTF